MNEQLACGKTLSMVNAANTNLVEVKDVADFLLVVPLVLLVQQILNGPLDCSRDLEELGQVTTATFMANMAHLSCYFSSNQPKFFPM